MQVTKDTKLHLDVAPRTITTETMQQDFEFEMAERMARSLYENGMISLDELNRISALNKEKFYPLYKDIM